MGTSSHHSLEQLAGGVHSTSPAPAEADRLLDMLYELEALREQLALEAHSAAQTRLELANARHRYFELYEVAPVAYLNVDADLRIRRVNLTASLLFEIERRALSKMALGELFEAAAVEQIRRASATVLAEDEAVTLRHLPARTLDKELKVIVTSADDSVLLAVLEDAPDVATEERERTRNAELQTILDAVGAGIVTVDHRGRILSCNLSAVSLFERPAEQLLGLPLVRLVPELGSVPKLGHYELTAHVGTRRVPVEVSVTAVARSPAVLAVALSDISERRQGQRERNEALLRFNQIAEHITDAFYVAVASSGESLYVSPAFARLYGRPLVAHHGEPWPRLRWVHEDDRPRVSAGVQELWSGGSFDIEYRVVHPDGDVRILHDRAFMLPDERRVTGIVRDVTHERAIEEGLRQAQRLEAMGTLASGVAHDFNNLLMGLGGCVQLARTRLEPEHAAQGYLRRASEAIMRGANLTRQILRIGETGRSPEGTVVLDDVLSRLRDVLKSVLGDAVSLIMSLGAAQRHIAAEPADIEQILLNLVTNARDAMPRGGTLSIITTVVGTDVILDVDDTGAGMSPQVQARVFEPFFTTKDETRGTGLGLATVFALVRRLRGSVTLESEIGRGTLVRTRFPLVEPRVDVRPPDSSYPPSGGGTVLIVDDDPLVRLTVETHLETLGYRMLVASSAEEAIEICEDPAINIDVMVSDVMMPGMLGPQLFETLRKRNKKFPVVYMSAHPQEVLMRQGHLAENSRVLAKPFDAGALGEALELALADDRAARGSVSRRLFVIDDDLDIAEGLKESLELEGHTVGIATSAAEALRVVPEFRPNVVFCDVALGAGADGFELTAALRRDPRVADTTFIGLTGFQSSEVKEQARQAGMLRVLTKPIGTDRLLEMLKSVPV
jgi:PAS domain S-box-containing protein